MAIQVKDNELCLELRTKKDGVSIIYNKPCPLTFVDGYADFETEVVNIRSEIFSRFCRSGKLGKAQHMLKRGLLNHNYRGVSGTEWSALHNAAYFGHLAVVQWLVNDLEMEVNQVSETDGWTPLHCACARGHHEVGAFLLEKGASLLAFTLTGETALSLMTHFGHIDSVLALAGPQSSFVEILLKAQGERKMVSDTGMFTLLPKIPSL